MLTAKERAAAKSAIENRVHLLKAGLEVHLAEPEPALYRETTAQVEKLEKWLLRQIEETAGSG
jgi:hypothetical protein